MFLAEATSLGTQSQLSLKLWFTFSDPRHEARGRHVATWLTCTALWTVSAEMSSHVPATLDILTD